MARPLTSAEREELGHEAYALSLKGKSQRQIGRELELHHDTVGSLIREQIKHRRLERRDSVHSLLDQFDAAIGEAWERLQALPKSSASPASAGLLSSLHQLLKAKTSILGYEAPKRHQTQSVVYRYDAAESLVDRLDDQQLKEFRQMLARFFPDEFLAEAGDPETIDVNGTNIRQLGPSRQAGEMG